jgi:hypothetical protein
MFAVLVPDLHHGGQNELHFSLHEVDDEAVEEEDGCLRGDEADGADEKEDGGLRGERG